MCEPAPGTRIPEDERRVSIAGGNDLAVGCDCHVVNGGMMAQELAEFSPRCRVPESHDRTVRGDQSLASGPECDGIHLVLPGRTADLATPGVVPISKVPSSRNQPFAVTREGDAVTDLEFRKLPVELTRREAPQARALVSILRGEQLAIGGEDEVALPRIIDLDGIDKKRAGAEAWADGRSGSPVGPPRPRRADCLSRLPRAYRPARTARSVPS